MGNTTQRPVSIGVLWRGDRGAARPAEDRGLAPLFDAFEQLPVDVVPLPFSDDRASAVSSQLRGLDGVLVWVNPVQDGVTRGRVDEILQEASAKGIWVSAHPEVIRKMGTKEVLYRTRHLGWGADCDIYRSVDEFAARFPARLAHHGRLVVKQGRGNGGNGVWGVALAEPAITPSSGSRLRVLDASARDGAVELITLDAFVERCAGYFAWSGFLVDQEYQDRLGEGMVRCYFSHDEVVGFSRQWPKGLLELGPGTPGREAVASTREGPGVAAYQRLRRRAEREWVPEMARLLDLRPHELPVIWDADFLYGPKDEAGEDGFVLCEINVSAVWPFPPVAAATIAAKTLARVSEAVRKR